MTLRNTVACSLKYLKLLILSIKKNRYKVVLMFVYFFIFFRAALRHKFLAPDILKNFTDGS